MKIELQQLLKGEGARVQLQEAEFTPEELEIDRADAILSEPVVLSGEFVNLGGGVIELKAKGSYVLKLECARCLKEFTRRFPCEIREVFREPEDWEDFLTDGLIDVTEIVRYALVLGMESRYLCRPDCKGLCARCGKDLNEGACGCEKEIDPRLSVLKELFKDER